MEFDYNFSVGYVKRFRSRINVVRFHNGTYGVRAGKLYFDLTNTNFKWYKSDQYFKDCQGTEEQAMRVYKALTEKDEVIL